VEIPGVVILVGGLAVAGVILRIRALSTRFREVDATLRAEREASRKKDATIGEIRAKLNLQSQSNEELMRLLKEKSGAMPWIAEMVADVLLIRDERDAERLETKAHPAAKAAETVREHAQEKRRLRVEKRLVEYRLALMESLFPWLREIGFTDAEKVAEAKVREADDDGDPVARWLTKDEWSSLSVTERNQRALDRYKKRAKSDWEIGRDFERFIGYHWENKGYDVVYYGAIKGFDDFGRDLIITGKTGKVALIQCKYWARYKVIPEAAVFQLLGSTVSYYIEQTGHPPPDLTTLYRYIQPYLYSSSPVAPHIRDIALAMGIKVKDDLVMDDWPMVKCNIAVGGERIYHLPMDQQYDRVKLDKASECYAWTVAEAEAKGFRRAKRWIAAKA
jgi:hypothetical protein